MSGDQLRIEDEDDDVCAVYTVAETQFFGLASPFDCNQGGIVVGSGNGTLGGARTCDARICGASWAARQTSSSWLPWRHLLHRAAARRHHRALGARRGKIRVRLSTKRSATSGSPLWQQQLALDVQQLADDDALNTNPPTPCQ